MAGVVTPNYRATSANEAMGSSLCHLVVEDPKVRGLLGEFDKSATVAPRLEQVFESAKALLEREDILIPPLGIRP
jgi:hypothetical protein